ncbi:hypothetical protein B296_00000254 [Ensete ventricosum]|uniref:Uncharacterized protein n=1 Tax=Ensete ventricosum TaxID=4639 RepID=A0A427B3A7_ENSVE|nr:hypothetical protein B296_00000254 [Ensete ventricosum]
MLTSGLSARLMRYLRTQMFGDSSSGQRDVTSLVEAKRASASSSTKDRDETRGRSCQVSGFAHLESSRTGDQRLTSDPNADKGSVKNDGTRQVCGDDSWGDGGDSLKSERTDSSSDLVGQNQMTAEYSDLVGNRWQDKNLLDGKSKYGERDIAGQSGQDDDLEDSKGVDLLKRGLNHGFPRSKAKGNISGGTSENLRSASQSSGSYLGGNGQLLREINLAKHEDIEKVVDTNNKLSIVDRDGLVIGKDNDERLLDCNIGKKDISEMVKKAIRAAEAEARTANAPEEAIKAAGDAAAELVKTAATEVIHPALNVLVNLVCPPPSISIKPSVSAQGQQPVSLQTLNGPSENRERHPERNNSDSGVTFTIQNEPRERIMEPNLVDRGNAAVPGCSSGTPAPAISAGVVGDRRISLGSGSGCAGLAAQLEQGYRQAREAVRANNGIKVLLHLLNPRMITPPAALDCIRALACRVLLGLARDEAIAHILTRLQVGKKLSELIRDLSSQASGTEQARWQSELVQVSIELIAVKVWDLRKFKLLRTVPSLDQTVITFNGGGDVIYAILRRNLEEITSAINTRRVRHPLFPAFRTIDAANYSDIATVQVDRCILDFATHPTDSFVGVIAMDDHEEMFSSARLYEVGRKRATDDDSDPDDGGDTDEDDDENESEADMDSIFDADLAGDGDTDSDDMSNEDDDVDSVDELDDGDLNEDEIEFEGGQGLLEIMAEGDEDVEDSEVMESFSSGEEEDFAGHGFAL